MEKTKKTDFTKIYGYYDSPVKQRFKREHNDFYNETYGTYRSIFTDRVKPYYEEGVIAIKNEEELTR